MTMTKAAAALAALLLLGACSDGTPDTLAADPVASGQGGDTLTGLGESDDPLAGGSGDMGGGGDVAGSEM